MYVFAFESTHIPQQTQTHFLHTEALPHSDIDNLIIPKISECNTQIVIRHNNIRDVLVESEVDIAVDVTVISPLNSNEARFAGGQQLYLQRSVQMILIEVRGTWIDLCTLAVKAYSAWCIEAQHSISVNDCPRWLQIFMSICLSISDAD